MRFSHMCLIAVLALGSHACGDSGKPTRIATFNVGLAPGYEPNVAERKTAAQAALAAEAKDLDVLCVQEYWRDADWQDLVAATAAELPYALRRAAEPGPASCTTTELDPLMSCLAASCAGLSGDPLVSCALAHCSAEVGRLSSGCTACVTQDLTLPFAQIYQVCTSGSTTGSTDTAALYGGSFDVGMLSRRPFLDKDSKRLDAFMVRVGVLYGKIATDAGELHVFCTHLTSDIGDWAYAGAHGSWREENTFEAQQLRDYVAEKTQGGGAAVAVILGDLNTGSALGSIQESWPESLAVLTAAGFSDPFLAQADVRCSSCPDNTQQSPSSSPTLIDHVLLRGFTGKATVERIFTEPMTIQVAGAPVSTSLSDHYGLAVTLER